MVRNIHIYGVCVYLFIYMIPRTTSKKGYVKFGVEKYKILLKDIKEDLNGQTILMNEKAHHGNEYQFLPN